jgi:hypothetical protein
MSSEKFDNVDSLNKVTSTKSRKQGAGCGGANSDIKASLIYTSSLDKESQQAQMVEPRYRDKKLRQNYFRNSNNNEEEDRVKNTEKEKTIDCYRPKKERKIL